jgi:hypothetical protein
VSRSNLDLVRELYPAGGVDWVSLRRPEDEEAFVARVSPLLHPGFELVWTNPSTGIRSGSGLASIRRGLRQAMQPYRRFRATPTTLVDLGSRVLAFVRRDAELLDGSETVVAGSILFEMSEGLILRMQLFTDEAGGLEAAGITADEARRRAVPAHPDAPPPASP